jgi:hypothetical protein
VGCSRGYFLRVCAILNLSVLRPSYCPTCQSWASDTNAKFVFVLLDFAKENSLAFFTLHRHNIADMFFSLFFL